MAKRDRHYSLHTFPSHPDFRASVEVFADTCLVTTFDSLAAIPDDADACLTSDYPLPPWLGREDIHLVHHSRPLARALELDRPLFPVEADTLDCAATAEMRGGK